VALITACPETGPTSIEKVALLIGSLSESNMVIIKSPVTEELLRLDTLNFKNRPCVHKMFLTTNPSTFVIAMFEFSAAFALFENNSPTMIEEHINLNFCIRLFPIIPLKFNANSLLEP
jgi:hypothetical protein